MQTLSEAMRFQLSLHSGLNAPRSSGPSSRTRPALSIKASYCRLPPPSADAKRLEDWMRSPNDVFGVLALGPRLMAGVLADLPQVLGSLPAEANHFYTLLQDPRPLVDKQRLVTQELNKRSAAYVARGVSIETELLASVSGMLSAEMQQQLPPEVRSRQASAAPGNASTFTSASQATQTAAPGSAGTRMSANALASSRTAAEMAELKSSVVALREALIVLAANADPAQEAMLRLNVCESQALLRRRLQQLAPPSVATLQEAPITAATQEAAALLAEVDAFSL